jgi:hypothetical protein
MASRQHFGIISANAVQTVQTSADQESLGGTRGVRVHVAVSNDLGTFQYTPSLDVKVSATAYVTVWTAAADLTADGDYTYLFYPGATASLDTEVSDFPISPVYRVVVTDTVADADNNADIDVNVDELA